LVVARLEADDEVLILDLLVALQHQTELVLQERALLSRIEDEREVHAGTGLAIVFDQIDHQSQTALHVRRARTVKAVALDPRGTLVRRPDHVEVPRERDAPSTGSARHGNHQRIAVASRGSGQRTVAEAPQHRVAERLLLSDRRGYLTEPEQELGQAR